MNTTTAIVAAAALVVTSRWYAGKKVSPSIAVGAGTAIISLSVMSNVDEGLAQQFSYLILLAATYTAANDFGWV